MDFQFYKTLNNDVKSNNKKFQKIVEVDKNSLLLQKKTPEPSILGK